MAEDGTSLAEQTIVVLGKHVSNHGLDFYCSQPLPFRRVVACFECGHGPQVRLLLDLTWCRFCQHGWYENGGRFLQAVGTQVGAARGARRSTSCRGHEESSQWQSGEWQANRKTTDGLIVSGE